MHKNELVRRTYTCVDIRYAQCMIYKLQIRNYLQPIFVISDYLFAFSLNFAIVSIYISLSGKDPPLF